MFLWAEMSLATIWFVIKVTLDIKELPLSVLLRPRLFGIPRRHHLEKPREDFQVSRANVGSGPQILKKLSGGTAHTSVSGTLQISREGQGPCTFWGSVERLRCYDYGESWYFLKIVNRLPFFFF